MSISVRIVAGNNLQDSSAMAQGSLVHVITDAERRTFRIGTDNELRNAAGVVQRRTPNDAFVRSPTPWGDLFITYNWQQTETFLRPVSARILEISSEPTILATQRFVNNSSVAATFEAGISQEVSNTSESNWSNSNTVSFQQSIEYGISFLGTGVTGETTLGYDRTWGVGGSESISVTVGSSSGVSVLLQPGEAVRSILRATRGAMRIRVTYEANLRGNAALNYNPTHNGHHFWRQPIAPVINAAGSNNLVQITEDIRIGYYSHGEVILEDDHGNRKSFENTSPGIMPFNKPLPDYIPEASL